MPSRPGREARWWDLSNLIEPFDRAVQPELHAQQAGDFAERALQATLCTGSIVADNIQDQRVVECV